MDPLTNTAFIIFSGISPLLISFVKQSGLSTQANALIAFACYIVVGILGALLSGEALIIENIVPLITIATVVGSAAYGLIWSNIGGSVSVDDRITEATSFVK
jgi:hypothetical protein